MQSYTEKIFSIPALSGISPKQIEEHLKLYHGYVTHTNTLIDTLENTETDSYVRAELGRRFAFEFNGMRLHEYYFGALEGGSQPLTSTSVLGKALREQFGSLDAFQERLVTVALTRGSGWTILSYDPLGKQFVIDWVDEHHLGHLGGLPIVLPVDVWEHAFMIDYLPGERATYVESYLSNVNWETITSWFEKAHIYALV